MNHWHHHHHVHDNYLVSNSRNRLRKLNSTPCVSPVGRHHYCHLLVIILMKTMLMSMMRVMMRVRMTTLLSSLEERLFNLPLSMFNWPWGGAIHGVALQHPSYLITLDSINDTATIPLYTLLQPLYIPLYTLIQPLYIPLYTLIQPHHTF